MIHLTDREIEIVDNALEALKDNCYGEFGREEIVKIQCYLQTKITKKQEPEKSKKGE